MSCHLENFIIKLRVAAKDTRAGRMSGGATQLAEWRCSARLRDEIHIYLKEF